MVWTRAEDIKDPLAEAVEVEDSFTYAIAKRRNENWPLYYFRLDSKGRVQRLNLHWSYGPQRFYERGDNEQLLITYKRGRWGCQHLPSRGELSPDKQEALAAYLDAQSQLTVEENGDMRDSEKSLVAMCTIENAMIPTFFEAGDLKEFEYLLEAFDMKRYI